MNLSCLDDVIVIQDHDQIVVKLGDVIDQTDRHRLGAAQLECTNDLARFYPYLRVDCLNGCDQVRPEPDRVVVTRVKRKPRCGLITLGKPACHQGRFPESRWRRDQGQLARQTFVQALIKLWACDGIRVELGDVQFGCEELFHFLPWSTWLLYKRNQLRVGSVQIGVQREGIDRHSCRGEKCRNIIRTLFIIMVNAKGRSNSILRGESYQSGAHFVRHVLRFKFRAA